jgi:hypothetical protein
MTCLSARSERPVPRRLGRPLLPDKTQGLLTTMIQASETGSSVIRFASRLKWEIRLRPTF